jgi:hypothetical protein
MGEGPGEEQTARYLYFIDCFQYFTKIWKRVGVARLAAADDNRVGVSRPPPRAKKGGPIGGKCHAPLVITILLSMIYVNVIFVSLRLVFAPRRARPEALDPRRPEAIQLPHLFSARDIAVYQHT